MAAITATVLSIGGNPLQNARPRPLRSLLITSPIHLRRFNPLQLQVRLHLTTRPISRRNLWVAATSLWDAITSSLTGGQNSAREAALAVRRGMQLFVQGDVEQSVVEFDKAIELDPRQKKYLWQRGLSLYYLNRFEEGATQFRDDVAANPNDTEESIWCFLCEAQIDGVDEARRRFLEVGPDPRPVMRKAYLMFKNGGDPQEVLLIEKSAARKVWQEKCDRKIVAEKVRQKKCGRKIVAEKSWQKKHGRKITVEKSRQKKCGRKIATTTWLGSIYERYGTSCLRHVL